MVFAKFDVVVIVAILCLFWCSLCVNLSPIHRYHNSDSVIYPLMSLDRWTPFAWEQARFGMLLPLLAGWVKDYRLNLLFQSQLTVWAAFGSLLILSCYFLSAERGLSIRNLTVTGISAALCLWLLRPSVPLLTSLFFVNNPYSVSWFLVIAAAALLMRGPPDRREARAGLGLLCLLLAFWVNLSNIPLALTMILALPMSGGSYKRTLRRRLAISVLAGLAAFANIRFALSYAGPEVYGLVPLSEIPAAFRELLEATIVYCVHPNRILILLGIYAVFLPVPKFSARLTTEALILAAVAIGAAVGISALQWVSMNEYDARYWTTPLIMLVSTLAACTSGAVYDSVKRVTRSERALSLCASLLCVAAFGWTWGTPSATRALSSLDQVTSVKRGAVRQQGCTHVIGDFWFVWLTVFHSRGEGDRPPLWGISYRAKPTESRFAAVPDELRRYCGICGDKWIEQYREEFRLPAFQEIGRQDDVCVFRGASPRKAPVAARTP